MHAQSRLVHEMRQMGAGGIWLPPGPRMAMDVSGYGRHAVPDSPNGAALSGFTPDNRRPGYDGIAGQTNGAFIAPIDTITDNSTTLVAYVNVPTTSEQGSFLMLSEGATRGLGIGIGASTWVSAGNNYIALNEGLAWHVGGAIDVGWHLFTLVAGTGASSAFRYIDETSSTFTLSNLAAGTVNHAHIAGYTGSARSTTCVVGLTAYFNKLLTAGQVQTLAKCARRDRSI